MLQLLIIVRDETAQAIVGLMEAKQEMIGGYMVERTNPPKTEWDKTGAWVATRHAIIDRLARNGPRMDEAKAELIERCMSDIDVAFAVSPRLTGLKAVGVNGHEYRAVTPATRWNVKVIG